MTAAALAVTFVFAALLFAVNRTLLDKVRRQARDLRALRYEVGMYRRRELAELLLGPDAHLVSLHAELDDWIDEALG